MRPLLIALLAVILAAPAVAARITVSQDIDGNLILTARMLQPGTYAASCELPNQNIGTSGYPSKPNGKVSVPVPLGGSSGAFTCWIRADLGSFIAPPAPLANGRPALVHGVTQ